MAKSKKVPVEKTVVGSDSFEEVIKTMFSFSTKAEAEAFQAKHTFQGVGLNQMLEVVGRYKHNFNPIQTVANLLLAQRYHHLIITKLKLTCERDNREATFAETDKTFRQYEAKAKAFDDGLIANDEIIYLQSLPSIEDWNNHTFNLNEVNAFYWKDEPVEEVVVKPVTPKVVDELESLINFEADTYKPEQRKKLIAMRKELFDLFMIKHKNRQVAINALRESIGA